MNKTFSVNMLKTYEESIDKYKLIYDEKVSMPKNNAVSEAGKNLHALINYYLKGFEISKLVQALNNSEKILWNNFLKLNITPENIYKSESTFNHKIDKNTWLTGRIDAIVKANNNIIIYDWKTGNIPQDSKNDIQSIVYLFCLYNKLYKENMINDYSQLSFMYVNLKNLKTFEIKLSSGNYRMYKNYIFDKIKEIKQSCCKT